MNLLVTPEAERHIDTIDLWWRENRTAAPELFEQELAAALDLIETWPGIGRQRRHRSIPGLRRVLLRSTRYHVYYAPSPDGDTVFVLAVWSAVRGRMPKMDAPE
ncbi:MAG: plasmid stabilization system protein ParE [Planctomycetota bacterium]